MLAYRSLPRLLRPKFLHTSRAPCADQVEDHVAVQELMDSGYAPPNNHTLKKKYYINKSLLASWRQQRRTAGSKFKDVTVIKLRSGDGGNGKVSFLRESGRSVGPPDGGDGGAGGNVFIQASPQISSLAHLRHIYNAQNGKTGGTTQLTGKRGDNVVIQVPVGTKIRWSPPVAELRELEYAARGDNHDELEHEHEVKDQDKDEDEISETSKEATEESEASKETDEANVVIDVDVVSNWSRFDQDTSIQLSRETFNDGVGGWAFREQEEEKWMNNTHFKRIMQRVKQFDLINRRQERNTDMFPYNGMDLQTAGDPILLLTGGAGGLGNMHFQTPELRSPSFAKQGRSGIEITLMLELKILADLGLVGLPNAGKSTLLRAISRARPAVGDYEFTTLVPSVGTINMGIEGRKFSVADIPGIIKDAHLDKGLGLGFLRHIERCRGFAFVVALDKPDPVADMDLLLEELGTRVDGKNILIIATKADTPDAEGRYTKLAKYAAENEWQIVPCSAINGDVHGIIKKMAEAAEIPSS